MTFYDVETTILKNKLLEKCKLDQVGVFGSVIRTRDVHDIDILVDNVKDFRNRIVHDYVNIDIFIVFDIIKEKLDIIKNHIQNIIQTELRDGNFDPQEIVVAKDSSYYRHIDFKKIII